jgi:hypothetical protein
MLDKKLKEALELLGGRAVIKDQDEHYILLTLREFRKIKQEGVLGLTKQELVDKINNDIASWKFSQEEDHLAEIELETLGEIKNDEVHYESVIQA